MSVEASEEVARYFPAAQIDAIPDDLSKPRHILGPVSAEQRRKNQKRCAIATEIWNAAETDAGRRAALEAYLANGDADRDDFKALEMFLGGARNRLPPAEIEFAMDRLGLADADNSVLSDAEKAALDRDGYVQSRAATRSASTAENA